MDGVKGIKGHEEVMASVQKWDIRVRKHLKSRRNRKIVRGHVCSAWGSSDYLDT